MKHTKIFVSLCTLIALPAQAGFKNRLLRTLPTLAIGASAYESLSSPIKSFLHYQNTVGKPERVDQQATEWIEKTLRRYGALGPNEQQPAIWGDEWSNVKDTIITVPRALHSEGNPEIAALHERKHYISQDVFNRCITRITLAAAGWMLGFAPFMRTTFRQPPTFFDSFGKSIIVYEIPRAISTTALAFGDSYFSRQRERKADYFAIKHIGNRPDYLAEEALFYLDQHIQFMAKNLGKPDWEITILNLLKDHPSHLERAEYFKKAAEELRKKQQSKKS